VRGELADVRHRDRVEHRSRAAPWSRHVVVLILSAQYRSARFQRMPIVRILTILLLLSNHRRMHR